MQKNRPKEWFDNNDFWKDLYPFMFPEERFAQTEEEIQKVLALIKPVRKAALDLCCGPGRCSIALAKARFQVTGVDRTEFLLNKARTMAQEAKVQIDWLMMDMRDFVREKKFDLVLSMFTSFGYFDDKQENELVLSNILSSLKPGGVCLIELMGKENLAKIFQSTIYNKLSDGSIVVQRHEIIDDWNRIRNEWILIRNEKAKTFKFNLTIYSGQELRNLLERVGFSEVKLYGKLDGDEYGIRLAQIWFSTSL